MTAAPSAAAAAGPSPRNCIRLSSTWGSAAAANIRSGCAWPRDDETSRRRRIGADRGRDNGSGGDGDGDETDAIVVAGGNEAPRSPYRESVRKHPGRSTAALSARRHESVELASPRISARRRDRPRPLSLLRRSFRAERRRWGVTEPRERVRGASRAIVVWWFSK